MGEILFFKKPKTHLKVSISFDKEIYAPGDTVKFEIDITDNNATEEAYVTVFATDDSVFY